MHCVKNKNNELSEVPTIKLLKTVVERDQCQSKIESIVDLRKECEKSDYFAVRLIQSGGRKYTFFSKKYLVVKKTDRGFMTQLFSIDQASDWMCYHSIEIYETILPLEDYLKTPTKEELVSSYPYEDEDRSVIQLAPTFSGKVNSQGRDGLLSEADWDSIHWTVE